MNAPFSKLNYGKICVGFCLNTGNAFSERNHFKANRKNRFFYKIGSRNFQNSPSFERSACFYVTMSGNSEHFRYFNFEIDFLENENFFEKNWRTVF